LHNQQLLESEKNSQEVWALLEGYNDIVEKLS